jgi:hypothetical protein
LTPEHRLTNCDKSANANLVTPQEGADTFGQVSNHFVMFCAYLGMFFTRMGSTSSIDSGAVQLGIRYDVSSQPSENCHARLICGNHNSERRINRFGLTSVGRVEANGWGVTG